MSHAIVAPSVAVTLERITTLWHELLPLAEAHNAEVGAFPELPFRLDREVLEQWDGFNALRVFTVRDGERLIGYAAFVLMPCLFHPVKVAHHLALYLVPEFRRQGIANHLLAICDGILRVEGARLVFQHTKDGAGDHGALLRRLGYQLVDHVYVRRL